MFQLIFTVTALVIDICLRLVTMALRLAAVIAKMLLRFVPKRIIALLALVALLASPIRIGGSVSAAEPAVPSRQAFYLDDKSVAVAAYNIGGNNYVKLRDICKLLDYGLSIGNKGRNGEFIVYFYSTAGYSGAADANDGVMPEANAAAADSSVFFYFNNVGVLTDTNPLGQMVPGEHNRIAAYNINGNNYIQLCDMAQKIDKWGGAGADGFDVRFNSEDNSVNLFSNTQFTGLDIGAEPQPKQGRRLESDVEEYMLSPEYTDAVREEFYILLNEHRVANGLTELEINLELQKYADIRADELRIRFGHIRPDESAAGSGWYDSKNYMNSRYAENAHGVGRLNSDPKTEAENIFTAWENSEGHNRHMLYDFDSNITMALGIVPKLDDDGIVRSGAIFATGY